MTAIRFEHQGQAFYYHVHCRDFISEDKLPWYHTTDLDVSLNIDFFLQQAESMYPNKNLHLIYFN